MHPFQSWTAKIQDANGAPQPIYSVIYTLDGLYLVAAAGSEVLVYNSEEGELFRSLKAHKDSVICLCPLRGNGFASGGADKQVIIWGSNLEGILKYSHNDNIQALAQSPTSNTILSCSTSDFGLWSPDVKFVNKTKVPSRILCCSWAPDGQHFALGLFNGCISIRHRTCEEHIRIERGDAPIWSLSWSPSTELESEVIAVTDWNQRLSFFQRNGRQIGKDRVLGYDPCTVSFFDSGEYLLLGGSDREVNLWTPEGIKIGPICKQDSWIWSAKVHPTRSAVAIATNDGVIATYNVMFHTVHGFYNDRYAFRSNMTDVIIQHLSTEQRAKIKCRDYVKKISIYKDRLAVQLPDRIIIYELFHDDAGDMHYRIKDKLFKDVECNLLVVTSQHIILCLDKKLRMMSFSADIEREWNLEAVIRYIKVTGGPRGREGLLIGLKDGTVLKIFLDSPFPIPLIKHPTSIRCLDFNSGRSKIAVVDDQNVCSVYDTQSKELMYQEPNANSVAWNSEVEDMICFSGNGTLSVKVANFSIYQQKLNGFVVGYKGSRVFSLEVYRMTTLDIPQTPTMERYIEKLDFEAAYKVASLGVPDSDWRRLGLDAMEHLFLDIAKNCFVRTREFRYLEVIRSIEKLKAEGRKETDLFLAQVNAYAEKYTDAARLFRRAGHVQRAIEMYTELNMWDYATQLAEESNGKVADILKRKARMLEERKDMLAAASTYEQIGDFLQAIDILGQGGWMNQLVDLVRKLTGSSSKELQKALVYFKASGNSGYMFEALQKLGDAKGILDLHIELQQWDEAFKVIETNSELSERLYLPYGHWLAMNDRFEEAQSYYIKAGRPEEAIRVLRRLCETSVVHQQFNDAAYYFFTLSKEYLEVIPKDLPESKLNASQRKSLASYYKFAELAEVYHAYNQIFRYIEDPFIFTLPASLLNMSKFVHVYLTKNRVPSGVSSIYTLYTMAKMSKTLKGYKLCRYALEKLQSVKLFPKWQNTIDVMSALIKVHPNKDHEDLHVTCYNCSSVNPPLNVKDNRCPSCGEPEVLSFYSFFNLPLVQFSVKDEESAQEIEKLFGNDPHRVTSKEILTSSEESIHQNLSGLSQSSSVGDYKPSVLTRKKISRLRPSDVLVRKWTHKCLATQYFRKVSDHIRVIMCKACLHFFMEAEWESEVLAHGRCPFCRSKSVL